MSKIFSLKSYLFENRKAWINVFFKYSPVLLVNVEGSDALLQNNYKAI